MIGILPAITSLSETAAPAACTKEILALERVVEQLAGEMRDRRQTGANKNLPNKNLRTISVVSLAASARPSQGVPHEDQPKEMDRPSPLTSPNSLLASYLLQ
jgi:hypothetical protein